MKIDTLPLCRLKEVFDCGKYQIFIRCFDSGTADFLINLTFSCFDHFSYFVSFFTLVCKIAALPLYNFVFMRKNFDILYFLILTQAKLVL